MDIWVICSVVSKFALYLGVITSAGLVFNAALFPQYIPQRVVAPRIAGFALLGAVSALVGFVLQGAVLMGEWSGVFDPEIWGILWETPVGTALVYYVIGCALMLMTLVLRRASLWGAILGGGIALYGFTQIGHITGPSEIVLLLHLGVVTFWIGVLTPLRWLIVQGHDTKMAAGLGYRFGKIAMVSVPVLIVAGLVLAYQLVGSFAGLLQPYGLTLCMKIAAVAVLLALGAVNKLRFVPGLRMGQIGAAQGLARSIRMEWVAFILIFAITAVLTSSLSPPG